MAILNERWVVANFAGHTNRGGERNVITLEDDPTQENRIVVVSVNGAARGSTSRAAEIAQHIVDCHNASLK